MSLTRRLFLLGTFGLSGCTGLTALGSAAEPRDTYELQPIDAGGRSSRSNRSLLVLAPSSPAAIATDRILIKRDPLSVTYLPDARWADAVPQMLQTVLVQSLASSGRIGFVGAQGAGPIPDTVLLTRIDAFEVIRLDDGGFEARISCELTMLRDRDQRVLGTRRFARSTVLSNDMGPTIASAFQQLLDAILVDVVGWVVPLA